MDLHVGNFTLAGSRHLHFISLYRSHRLYTWPTGQLSNHCLRYYSRDLWKSDTLFTFCCETICSFIVDFNSLILTLCLFKLWHVLTYVFPNFDKRIERMKRKIKDKKDHRSAFEKFFAHCAKYLCETFWKVLYIWFI